MVQVRELIRRGFNVIAFAREKSGIGGAASAEQTKQVCVLVLPCLHRIDLQEFEGADVRFGDVTDVESLRSVAFESQVDVVISCLASRTGGKVCTFLSKASRHDCVP